MNELMKRCGFLFLIGLWVLVAGFLAYGCATVPAGQENLATYLGARTAFNNYLELYLNYRDVMPDGEKKNQLRAGLEPKFYQASLMLDAWKLSMNTDDEVMARQTFNTVFDQLALNLMAYGVIGEGATNE